MPPLSSIVFGIEACISTLNGVLGLIPTPLSARNAEFIGSVPGVHAVSLGIASIGYISLLLLFLPHFKPCSIIHLLIYS